MFWKGGKETRVKKGAKIKAPQVFVGGDYQGKGNIKTAERTIVERGAMIDSGSDGYVIVWADETTWFNGRLKADFAEVSGKEELASVNILGIEVNDLLLDPGTIVIHTDAGMDEVIDGTIFEEDGGSAAFFNLSAAAISAFTGNLILQAASNIRFNSGSPQSINKTSGDLTLRSGGRLNLGNITVSGGTLTLHTTFGSSASTTIRSINNTTFTLSAQKIVIQIDSAVSLGSDFGRDSTKSNTAAFTVTTNDLEVTVGAAQTVHPWMVANGAICSCGRRPAISPSA